MLWSRYVIGYHGCDADLAREVVCNNTRLKMSQNDYDWLGNGIYFWEGNIQRALLWAENERNSGNRQIKKPAALGAVIDMGTCLNLVEAEYLEIVRKSYETMKIAFEASKSPMPENAGRDNGARKLDCAVFNYMHVVRKDQGLPPFDTIRAFFTEGNSLYPGAGIRQMDHIQICVRNPKTIIGYFLPDVRE